MWMKIQSNGAEINLYLSVHSMSNHLKKKALIWNLQKIKLNFGALILNI